jgi:hypothetical protein
MDVNEKSLPDAERRTKRLAAITAMTATRKRRTSRQLPTRSTSEDESPKVIAVTRPAI